MKDVRVQLAIGFLFFAIALIDSIARDATGFNELGTVGKGSVIGFIIVLAYLIGRYALYPLVIAIVKSIE